MAPIIYPESWGRDESGLWEEIAGDKQGDFGNSFESDRTAMALFESGWLEPSSETNTMLFRDAFFDYAIEEGFLYDRNEFDWEAWRDYMGY